MGESNPERQTEPEDARVPQDPGLCALSGSQPDTCYLIVLVGVLKQTTAQEVSKRYFKNGFEGKVQRYKHALEALAKNNDIVSYTV